ncbi:MAG: hypothetical protein LQ352_005876 [Teloschistes flavicans]|nr:MAG: hypothetical protein LQ352_005876 [Teloschistes flavicans]
MAESRNTTRPRLSLNCFTCRRRKVRCTKERPSCDSCLRTKDVCVYDEDAWETARSQPKKKQAPRKTTTKNQSKNRPRSTQDQDWVNWTTDPAKQASPRESPEDPNLEHSSSSENSLKATEDSTSRTTPAANEATRGDAVASDPPTSAADDMSLPNLTNIYDDFTTSSSWANAHLIDLIDLPDFGQEVILPSPDVSPVSDRQHPRALKRSRTPTDIPIQRVRSSMISLPRRMSDKVIATPSGQSSLDDDRLVTQDLPTSGFFSVRPGARVRYANPTFWAYVKGYDSLSETFLDGIDDPAKVSSQPHIDSSTLANLLSLLPSKQVCNWLLYSFLVGVRPLTSFVHIPTLRTDYNDFWKWYENLETTLPTGKLVDDPTFLCLLFSVLYCGSVTASDSFWAVGALQAVKRETVIRDLGHLLDSSLRCVQHLRHPTINTLSASLLSHSFMAQESDSEELNFVSVMIRTAQRMGLHVQNPTPKLDAATCEVRRLVWWHILWLDLQTSFMHGLPMHCLNNDAQRLAPIFGERSTNERSDRDATGLATPSVEEHSASMFLASGIFEATSFERLLVHHVHAGDVAQMRNVQTVTSALRRFQTKIDGLIASMPAQGIPEKGLIPSRLANASPLDSRDLYADHVHEPTVLTSLVRVMLNMSKTEAAIMLQKTLLTVGNPQSSELNSRWDRIVQLCTTYLRNFLQIIQTPAFSPYSWFCSHHFGPLQSTFLILAYLQQKRNADTEAQALFLIDEVLEFFVEHGRDEKTAADRANGDKQEARRSPTSTRANVAWQNLKAIRLQIPSPLKQHRVQRQKEQSKTQIQTTCSPGQSSHVMTPINRPFEPTTPNSAKAPRLNSSGQCPWSSARSSLLLSALTATMSQSDGHPRDSEQFINTMLDTSALDGSASSLIQSDDTAWANHGFTTVREPRDFNATFSRDPASAGTAMESGSDYFSKANSNWTRRSTPVSQDSAQARDLPTVDPPRTGGRSKSTDREDMSPFTGVDVYKDSSDNFSGMMLNGDFWTDM